MAGRPRVADESRVVTLTLPEDMWEAIASEVAERNEQRQPKEKKSTFPAEARDLIALGLAERERRKSEPGAR